MAHSFRNEIRHTPDDRFLDVVVQCETHSTFCKVSLNTAGLDSEQVALARRKAVADCRSKLTNEICPPE